MVWDYDLLSQTFVNGEYYDNALFKFNENNSIIVLYAIFELQKFGIKFYDGDGSLLVEDPLNPVYVVTGLNQQEQVTVLVPYDNLVPQPKKVPYKDDSSLDLEEVYKLAGWSVNPNPQIQDITNISQKKVRSNLSYYPVFEVEDVHNNPLDASFFDVEQSAYTQLSVTGAFATNEPCVRIKLKEGYTVRGKVTLPKMINGVKVGGIIAGNRDLPANGFSTNTAITHIFWETGAVPEDYSNYCFANCTRLSYVEFPTSLRIIKEFVFFQCGALINRDLSKCVNLIAIQGNAFNRAFAPTENTLFLIPASVQEVGNNAFSYDDVVTGTTIITRFQFGDDQNASRLNTLPSGNANAFRPNKTPYMFTAYVLPGVTVETFPWSRIAEWASQLDLVTVGQ